MLLFLSNLINKIKGYGINFFSYIASYFIFHPLSEPADTRSAFEILFTPFVNWFNKVKETLPSMGKVSLITSLLNIYKLYLSLLMACFFFIMYFIAYTSLGLIILGIYIILLMCTGIVIVDLVSPEGPFTEASIDAFRFFRNTAYIFSVLSASSLIISACAKIPFLRVILIDTVGSLSYKFYVGENPGSKAGMAWAVAPRLAGAIIGAGTVMAGVDQLITERQLAHMMEACKADGQIMTVEQKMAFYHKKAYFVTTLSKGIYSTFASSAITAANVAASASTATAAVVAVAESAASAASK